MDGTRKWIKWIIRILILTIIAFAVYSSTLILEKYIREGLKEYNSIEEVIEENYNTANLEVLNIREYYYLVTEKAIGNKEELVRFENKKYFTFDRILRNTKGIGLDSSTDFNSEIYFTDIDVYKYEGDYIIVIKREIGQKFVVIYDNYEVWKSKIIGETIYYFNVRNEEELTYNYVIFASVDDNVYEIANRTRIVVHVLD